MKSRKSMVSLGKGFIFVLGLLIISDIESKTQPKRTPRTRQLKPAPKRPSAAPPAEPAPTPAPSYLSSEEFDEMVTKIVNTPYWTDELQRLYAFNEPKFSPDQKRVMESILLQRSRTNELEGKTQELQANLDFLKQQLQKQTVRIQRSRTIIPEGIQAKPKTTSYWESLFDYEGLIAKLLPQDWTGAKAAALAAAMGTAGAAIAYFLPQLSDNMTAATAAMAALSASSMYAAISRGIDRLQKGAWTIDGAIEDIKHNLEQKTNDKGMYPTFESVDVGDFINLLNIDENIWYQAILRLKNDIQEKQKNIFTKLPQVAEQQTKINNKIKEIQNYYEDILDDSETYVAKLEKDHPDLFYYQAILSEYLRAQERIAIMKAQQNKLDQEEPAPQMKPIEPAPTITQPVQQPAPVTPTQQPVQPVSPSSQTPGIYRSLEKITSESTPQIPSIYPSVAPAPTPQPTPIPSAPLVETPTETPVAKEPASESWIPSWLSGLR